LVTVLEKFPVGEFNLGGEIEEGETSGEVARVKELLQEREVVMSKLWQGDKFVLGEVEVKVWWPKEEEEEEQRESNEKSMVLEFKKGNLRILVMGDAPKKVEQELVWRKDLSFPVSVLVAGHHGSKTSSSEELVEAVKPTVAVLSVGENSYGHPNEEVLKLFEGEGIEIWRTDKQGEFSYFW